jgi:hypothetical protein
MLMGHESVTQKLKRCTHHNVLYLSVTEECYWALFYLYIPLYTFLQNLLLHWYILHIKWYKNKNENSKWRPRVLKSVIKKATSLQNSVIFCTVKEWEDRALRRKMLIEIRRSSRSPQKLTRWASLQWGISRFFLDSCSPSCLQIADCARFKAGR